MHSILQTCTNRPMNLVSRIFVQRCQTTCIASLWRLDRHGLAKSHPDSDVLTPRSQHSRTYTSAWNGHSSNAQLLASPSSLLQPWGLSQATHHHILAQSGVHRNLQDLASSLSRSADLLSTKKQSLQTCPQRCQTSFSPTRAILESSPVSIQPYLRLVRFDKPIGTWLLYWPCTWSIALAAQPGCLPDFKLLALFGIGAFFMRGAGCIINDMWDKDIDCKVERTKLRPLASGELSRFQAFVFLGSQLSCALTILLQLNWYSVFLGTCAMVPVILYPLAKRYTNWPQLVLGFTFNYGALLGWSAVHGAVDWAVCLPLYTSAILWTMVYDTIYAHQDKYDDQLIGVKSTALNLGESTKPWLAGFTVAMASGLMGAGLLCDMTWPYYMAVLLTTGRLAQQVYSTNLNDADDCAKAFKGNFYLGAVLFTGIVLANLIKSPQEDPKDDLSKETQPS